MASQQGDLVVVTQLIDNQLIHVSDYRSLFVQDMIAISSTLKEDTFFVHSEDCELKRVERNVQHADSGRLMRSHDKNAHSRKQELVASLPPRHNAFQKMLSDLGDYLSCRGYSEYYDASLIHTLLTSFSNSHNYEQNQGVYF